MRTVGYIPEEGAEQEVTEQTGTPTPPEPKADGTETPATPESSADTSSTTPSEPKADTGKRGGKKE